MYRIILIWKIFTLYTFLKFNNGNISKTELNKDLYWKVLVTFLLFLELNLNTEEGTANEITHLFIFIKLRILS